jgi:hypothetical protein
MCVVSRDREFFGGLLAEWHVALPLEAALLLMSLLIGFVGSLLMWSRCQRLVRSQLHQ